MSKICAEFPATHPSKSWLADADIFVREEPDEEVDDGDGYNEDDGDGYSE